MQYLGKSGELTAQMKLLGGLRSEERKPFGQAVNAAKSRIEEAIDQRRAALQETAKPAGPELDVTLPGRRRWAGRVHPITATAETMKKILMGLGFSYDDYPDIESEYYNFDALNTPAWHPARDLHDTFYVGAGAVAAHAHHRVSGPRDARQRRPVPIRAMTTGRCYRADDIDASHYPIFQQLDVFAVGRGFTMSDLRWTLDGIGQGPVRPRSETALPSQLFSVHDAQRGSGRQLHGVPAEGLRSVFAHRLARSSGQRHDAAGGAAGGRARSRKSIRASPSASAWTASPCCGIRSMTSACSTTTRKLSCASSDY